MPGFSLPKIAQETTVKDREVLIDADCVAYWAAAGQDDMPLRAATRRADIRMKQIITETRADTYTGYLTGKDNFRDLVATLQRYKGNRYDKNGKRIKPQPAWLKDVRTYLESEWKCRMCHGQEADDALSIHNANAGHETIISSIDKDLRINIGLHHDMNSGEITPVSGFGELWMKGSECKGTGLKFFCAQLLMGDSADWIKGLPKVTPNIKAEFGIARLGGCGGKSAFTIINDAVDYDDAMDRVEFCYEDYWTEYGYKHWRTGKEYKPSKQLAVDQLNEQGQLLWMRTKEDEIWTHTLYR